MDLLLPLVIHDPFPFVPQGIKEQLDEPRLELRFARPGVIGEVKMMVADLSRGSPGLESAAGKQGWPTPARLRLCRCPERIPGSPRLSSDLSNKRLLGVPLWQLIELDHIEQRLVNMDATA